MKKESAVEKISGNVITTSVVTVIAAYAATPLAPLLPVLTNALASNRHKQRVEQAIADINETLTAHEGQLRELTDSQFKLINEVILVTLQNTEEKKLQYLKAAINNTFNINNDKIRDLDAAQLSRIIRDISSEEIVFLMNSSTRSLIIFDIDPKDDTELRIDRESREGEIVSGLISMGLLIPAETTYGNLGKYRFSTLVSKLLGLISSDLSLAS